MRTSLPPDTPNHSEVPKVEMSIVTRFNQAVRANPDGVAVVADERPATYRELAVLSDRYAAGLAEHGVRAGTRIAFMVPPGLDFMALCFALFKLGAVPVLIDAGMDMRNLRQCLEEAEPEVFIGSPRAHEARASLGWGSRTVRLNVTAGEPGDWGGPSLADLPEPTSPLTAADVAADDTAMILFTTGSTGPPKGAVYTQALCSAQLDALRDVFGWRPGGVDMPTLPTFAPYAVASGMTAVIPDMDFTRPGEVDPESLIAQIERHAVETMFGSPALIDRLGRHGAERDIKLPTLRRVLSAAAPVAPAVVERFSRMLEPDAELVVFYGLTEAIPIATIEAAEILGETASAWAAGEGTCLGRPLDLLETAVIPISDEPFAVWGPDLPIPAGEIGEFVVKGPVVSREYRGQPRANVMLKIYDPRDEQVWHRTGDAVKVDDSGRLWFQGRVAHRVRTPETTLFTIPTEAIFNQHPRVRRTALVGAGPPGSQRPVLCVELEDGDAREGSEELRRELLELGSDHPHTAMVADVLFHDAFPVDIRHNSKIFREKLAPWAEEHVNGARPAEPHGAYISLARRGFEAFAGHDASFLELLDPDIEADLPDGLPSGGALRGQMALLRFLDKQVELFEDPMVFPDKFVDAGDEIVVFGRWRAKGRRTGTQIDLPITMRWTFRRGLAVRYQSYIDTATIQAAL